MYRFGPGVISVATPIAAVADGEPFSQIDDLGGGESAPDCGLPTTGAKIAACKSKCFRLPTRFGIELDDQSRRSDFFTPGLDCADSP